MNNGAPDSISLTGLPPNPPAKKHARTLMVVGGIVVLLILASFVPSVRNQVALIQSAASMPNELRGAVFAAGPYALDKPTTLYSLQGLGYSAKSVDGVVLSAGKNGSNWFMLSYKPNVGASGPGTLTFSLPTTQFTLPAPPPILMTSFSPDGAWMAYGKGEVVAGSTTWHIVARTVADQKEQVIGKGFAAFILGDGNVLAFGSDGISLIDRAKATSTLLVAEKFANPLLSITMSPDRSLIAWKNPDSNDTVIYRIGKGSMMLLRTIPNLRFAPTLGNDGLYELRNLAPGHGMEIMRYSVDRVSDRVIGTLPDGMKITTIFL